jgi:sugar (pentulose or hexulose) kinase
MAPYQIAVIDIGKTNKKILIYDSNLNIIDERVKKFDEFEENGVKHDDVEGVTVWMLDCFKELSKVYDIRTISVSAHGATFVAIDNQGKIAIPEISYTTDPGKDFHDEFYNTCGDRIALQKSTGTPDFNLLINTGKGIYFAKKRYPDLFADVDKILFYAQYFGMFFTGNVCAEPTYTGNHTYMWNFLEMQWSSVTDAMGIRDKLPDKILKPWDVLGTIKPEIASATGLSKDVVVTAGIHDSNASLLPYMLSMDRDFILNSTGTWCVIMHEKNEVSFAEDELGKVVFYNMNAFSKPVKTAIFMGGLEFEKYTSVLKRIHGDRSFPKFNKALCQKVIKECQNFILPSVVEGLGQFPDSKPRVVEGDKVYTLDEIERENATPAFFEDFDLAYCVLNISLALQTKVSFDRADYTPGLPVFTEGGFSKNDTYNALMASIYPKSDFYLTNLKEATAYGAALLGKAAVEKSDILTLAEIVEIEKTSVKNPGILEIDPYFEKFMQLI